MSGGSGNDFNRDSCTTLPAYTCDDIPVPNIDHAPG